MVPSAARTVWLSMSGCVSEGSQVRCAVPWAAMVIGVSAQRLVGVQWAV